MSFVVRPQPPKTVAANTPFLQVPPQLQPQDIGSFMWGMVAGGIVMVVLGGVILYFTWPAFLALLKSLGLYALIAPQIMG